MALTGHSLTPETFLAFVRNEVEVHLVDQAGFDDAQERVQRSADALTKLLADGTTIYGVSTGFGGSADTRTVDHQALQRSLVQMLNSGVTLYDRPVESETSRDVRKVVLSSISAHVMPYDWVRGAMLIRINSLLRGHSGTSLDLINALLHLFKRGVTPLTPLRGSISASGDLAPLSYIAGTLQGNPDIYVHMTSSGQIMPADQALKQLGMQPLKLRPKEGLALTNGTAFSASVAAFATIGANHAAITAQMLTAMAAEALCGHAESFHPFISESRPHPGQREAAHNILTFLSGSKLARFRNDGRTTPIRQAIISSPAASNTLAQDRYALRTAPQWLGPYVEDLVLATRQVQTEMNSTTDNPLIDSSDLSHPECFNGGNFQACAITSATEKTRLALQSIGKLFFAQCSEILNPTTSNGLTPSCAASDPSLDFACKGLDINMAAYMSELAFLANPVSSHVQSAEMHNQSLNSLALISARRTIEALEIVELMQAAYLYVLCQALDVRVMLHRFYDEAERQVRELVQLTFGNETSSHDHFATTIWEHIQHSWPKTSTCDLPERATKAVDAIAPALLGSYATITGSQSATEHHFLLLDFQIALTVLLTQTYTRIRETHFDDYISITPTYLSPHTARIYCLVRKELKVPMFQGLRDEPTSADGRKSIGTYVGWIVAAVKEGRVGRVVEGCLGKDGVVDERCDGVVAEKDGDHEPDIFVQPNSEIAVNGHVKQDNHAQLDSHVQQEENQTQQNGHLEPNDFMQTNGHAEPNGYGQQNDHPAEHQEYAIIAKKDQKPAVTVTVTVIEKDDKQSQPDAHVEQEEPYVQLNGHVEHDCPA